MHALKLQCTRKMHSASYSVYILQLNTYARFTAQDNVQRSNTFARAVCAGELYDKYYSGKDKDINYIIAAATIIGPILLFMVAMAYIIFRITLKCIEENKASSVLHSTKRKNLVALGLLSIYITIYIFILDVIAANIVRISSHEYARELSPRNISFNLGVTYFTLACDLLALGAVIILFILIIIKKIKSVEGIFLSLLTATSICIITHLGYIMLAWITQPSRSTTTLLLYYFLFFYMYLMFRKTYKLGVRFKNSYSDYSPESELGKQIKKLFSKHTNKSETPNDPNSMEMPPLNCDSTTNGNAHPIDSRAGPPLNYDSTTNGNARPTDSSAGNASTPALKQKGIDVCLFFLIGVLGVFYLGVAVVFVMMIYLMPLASEDLFSYLFNVIQFMIVVVSTQYAYKLVVGKEFCFKKIVKHIKDIAIKEKVHEVPSNEGISKEIGKFVAEKLLIPQVKKNMKEECTSQPTTSSPH